jgi:hypothetical protein
MYFVLSRSRDILVAVLWQYGSTGTLVKQRNNPKPDGIGRSIWDVLNVSFLPKQSTLNGW